MYAQHNMDDMEQIISLSRLTLSHILTHLKMEMTVRLLMDTIPVREEHSW